MKNNKLIINWFGEYRNNLLKSLPGSFTDHVTSYEKLSEIYHLIDIIDNDFTFYIGKRCQLKIQADIKLLEEKIVILLLTEPAKSNNL